MATYTVSRSVRVAAPASAIYPLLVDLRRWREWSPFEGLDPDLERTYGGAESGVGATYAWAGNAKAGTGEMGITAATPDTSVVIEQSNHKPIRSSSTSTFTLTEADEADGATEVTWTMEGSAGGPAGLLARFGAMDKMIGPVFEKGLAQLTAVAETAQ